MKFSFAVEARAAMNRFFRRTAQAAMILAVAALSSCSATPPPPPTPEPLVLAPASPQRPDEWSLFPDPTTGNVDVYHKGAYAGSVNGNEPAAEDPPLPHRVAESPD
ncbi:MAG TPA: hypothetical protein VMU16_14335 [Candidatus Binataceae bacterium]|nr:hypothetical protein [Candidatus Binataceae bacterium]